MRPARSIDRAELVTESELVIALQTKVEAHAARLGRKRGAQQLAAADLGISQGALANVLTGGRTIGPDLAQALGFRRVVRFEPIE